MYELKNMVVFDNLNDYFISAKNSNTEMYFAHFLCRYEPLLTDKAKRFLKQYSLGDSRVDDLKQIFAVVL